MQAYYPIEINNTKQWISINGNPEKPLLLMLHGGPGTPCMSFFRTLNKPLLKDYLVVTWDQRGTGRSFSKHMDKDSMKVDQIVKDVHSLTLYLKNEFQKDKIFLLGHSFGATVGIKTAFLYPEDYHAYLGVSQFIHATNNEAFSYAWLTEEAHKRHDQKSIKLLKKVGEPIEGFYTGGLKATMQVKQLVTKYKGDSRNGMSSLQLIGRLLFSKEYGYHHFLKALKGIQWSLSTIGYDLKGIDYFREIPELLIPVYFFSGKYDQLTPQKILHNYYENLKAPQKMLYHFEHSAHSPLWEEADLFHRIMHEIATTF